MKLKKISSWKNFESIESKISKNEIRSWLLENGPITKRIKKNGSFKLHLIQDEYKQNLASIKSDDYYLLNLSTLKSDYKSIVKKDFYIIQTLIALCPILGLLGTVTGMIEVFDVVSFFGTGNARALASGITKATLPTMTGMAISIVGLLTYTVLHSKSQSIISEL